MDDAIVDLGVGKNMVRSIRHWGLACQLLRQEGRGGVAVSPWGDLLVRRWDPFLEDVASLWLVHWLLVNNPSRAGTWFLSFFVLPEVEFSRAGLLQWLVAQVDRRGWAVGKSTLARDIECFVHTYVPSGARAEAGDLPEDSLDCPLTDLRLVTSSEGGQRYQFNIGSKPTLPPEVFGFALLHYAASLGRSVLAMQECLYGVGSPGQAFKLDENSLVMLLERLQEATGGQVRLDETTGLKQVFIREETCGEELLAAYFGRRT